MNNLSEFNDPQIKFCIVIATYYRKNGSTKQLLERCLKSIAQQKYHNWVIYLIGDQYEKENELFSMIDLIETGKMIIYNKNESERNYIMDKKKLWCVGGASAMNYGLNIGRKNQLKYYAHLDDDDYWDPNHLLSMAHIFKSYPNCLFTFTKSTHVEHPKYMPKDDITAIYENNLLPSRNNIIHSSISFRMDILPYDYFTTKNEKQIVDPADAIMWDQIHQYLINHPQYHSIYIPSLTCYHDVEGFTKKN